MSKPSIRPELKSLLFMALEEQWGIIVREENHVLKLRDRLNFMRREDPIFKVLSFVISPTDPEHELWIIRSKRERVVEEPADGEEV